MSTPMPANVSGIASDGTISYKKPEKGKCYYPVATKIPRCSWHRYSDLSKGIPSRCVHPSRGGTLKKSDVDSMDCEFYEPRVTEGDVSAQSVVNATSSSTTMDANAFKAALIDPNEVRFGKVTVRKWEDADRPDILVPSLKFTYVDNKDAEQGSVLEMVARCIIDNEIGVLIGHLGAGKTTAVEAVCQRLNAPLVKVMCDGQLTVEQIIGTRIPMIDPVTGMNTLVWHDAPLLEAFRKGYIAVVDDYTFTGSDVFSAIYGIMTDDKYLVLATGEIIRNHENFRLFLTTNPTEYVELYPNRQQPDAAFMSRIHARFWVDYLPEVDERKVLQEAAPLLPASTLDRMQTVIRLSREYLKRGVINFAFSTRHAVNWAKKIARLGDFKRAAMEAFVADMDTESKSVMLGKILDTVLEK